MKIPKIGDEIYVDSSFYISHGEDDFVGGKCKISKIHLDKNLPDGHFNKVFITVEENPSASYNYTSLMEEQEKLKKEFGESRGYQYPDENRPWVEDGDYYNGQIYHGKPIW